MSTVVLDIEGTCSPLTAVRDQLFGYARDRYATWLAHARGASELAAVAKAREEAAARGVAAGNTDLLAEALREWTDQDVKSVGLKEIQGLIWDAGFSDGELIAPVYPDVVDALKRWHTQGVPVAIYSSGSVTAQRAWFAHTDHGDLSGYLTGYFDMSTAGPKRDPESYQRIARTLDVSPEQILFVTDSEAELAAATQAGWHSRGMRRPGNPAVSETTAWVWCTSFDELQVPAR